MEKDWNQFSLLWIRIFQVIWKYWREKENFNWNSHVGEHAIMLVKRYFCLSIFIIFLMLFCQSCLTLVSIKSCQRKMPLIENSGSFCWWNFAHFFDLLSLIRKKWLNFGETLLGFCSFFRFSSTFAFSASFQFLPSFPVLIMILVLMKWSVRFIIWFQDAIKIPWDEILFSWMGSRWCEIRFLTCLSLSLNCVNSEKLVITENEFDTKWYFSWSIFIPFIGQSRCIYFTHQRIHQSQTSPSLVLQFVIWLTFAKQDRQIVYALIIFRPLFSCFSIGN